MSGQFACAKRICHATDVAIPDMRQGCCLTVVLHRRRHAGGMSQYLRIWVPGGTYFFTVNLLERRRTLLVDHIDALRAAFRAAHAARPFHLIAYVILPDHLHCLWRLPDGDADNATRWRHIKSNFARSIPTGERLTTRRQAKGERGIWQRRYWEHLIHDEDDLRQHMDYIHINPLKHGHAVHVADWPYSSFHRYVRLGVVSLDWGG
jgi:putative transposase